MYRVTWFSTVLLGFILGLLFKHDEAASDCPAQEKQNASSSRRELLFLFSDQSVGVLQVGRLKGPSVIASESLSNQESSLINTGMQTEYALQELSYVSRQGCSSRSLAFRSLGQCRMD